MSFWENVEKIREYKDIPRKELAYRADFSLNSISTGIARNSVPLADVACRIAQVLGVSVEFLVTGKPTKKRQSAEKIEAALDSRREKITHLAEKYAVMLEEFSALSPSMQKAVSDVIHAAL
ncbi:MAG: helix-turn-helix domain-containing protein [Bacteroides sp.]|nr:helix-turn-helix domain-containing protein [Prevotella sp.]MCM1406871.1 helix-turn-helix domain-containing protein [Treponema brennaborense]MCM1470892.1 helix-turn-helix domain-containing protein [Bacteroides sp.]